MVEQLLTNGWVTWIGDGVGWVIKTGIGAALGVVTGVGTNTGTGAGAEIGIELAGTVVG